MANGKTFAELLEETRTRRGYTVHNCAKQGGVSEHEYREWISERGRPTKVQLRRMFGVNNTLEHYLDRDVAGDATSPVTIERVSPPPMPPGSPGSLGAMAHAFNKAGIVTLPSAGRSPAPAWFETLRQWREENALTLDELGVLLDVSASAVGAWERGDTAPIAMHVEKLRKLGPPLASMVIPESKEMAKPGPLPGASSSSQMPSAPTPTPAPPAPPPALAAVVDPLAAIDRVVMALDALGQTVGLAPFDRAPDGRWQVRLVITGEENPLAEGLGVSLSAAALNMLGSLRAGFAARHEQTQQIVRAATSRLDAHSKALAAIDGAVGASRAPA